MVAKQFDLRELKAHPIDVNTGCINYRGALNSNGYGSIREGGKIVGAHIFFYVKYKGPIHSNLWVLHRCNNPACINPEHLYLGTHKDNMKDKAKAGSVNTIGEKNPRATMTDETVLELRHLSKIYPDAVLADRYNLHIKTVGKIRRGMLWSHIPLEIPAATGWLKERLEEIKKQAMEGSLCGPL